MVGLNKKKVRRWEGKHNDSLFVLEGYKYHRKIDIFSSFKTDM